MARGLSRTAAARELNLDIQTVRRFANAGSAEELLSRAEHRVTRLDPFIDLVNQRWNEGVTSATAIAAELRGLGFRGDVQTVRRYLRHSAQEAARPPAAGSASRTGPRSPSPGISAGPC